MYPKKLTRQVVCEPGAAEVQTKAGKLRGVIVEGNYIFRGIKYAQAKRFQMPEPVTPWEGVKEAIIYGPVCPEMSTPIAHDEYTVPHYHYCQDENCHYLNVWTGSLDSNAKKPVMVWIHGGGWKTGSAIELYAYDGEEMAAYGDVVFVSVSHRLNCLGYLDMSAYGEEFKYSGVAGVADLVEALKWVRNNIANFGGDPDNVTILGQSGGGSKVRAVMQTPAADGLYHKAVIQSGITYDDPEMTQEMGRRLAEVTVENLGLSPEDGRKAAEVPFYKLARAVQAATHVVCAEFGLAQLRWQPVIGTDYFLGMPLFHGHNKGSENVPMMVGTCFGESFTNFNIKVGDGMKNTWSEEYVLEILKTRFPETAEQILEEYKKSYPDKAVADILFIDSRGRKCCLKYTHKRANECSAPIWNFMFNLEMPVSNGSTTWHNAEEAYVFHNAQYLEASYIPGITEELQDMMSRAWATFAHTGNPNHPGMPLWHPVGKDGVNSTMIFDRQVGMKYDHDKALMELLPIKQGQGGNRRAVDILGGGPRQSL